MKHIHTIIVDSDLVEESSTIRSTPKHFLKKDRDEVEIALVIRKADGRVIRFTGTAMTEFEEGDLCKIRVSDSKIKAGVIRQITKEGALVEFYSTNGSPTKDFFKWADIMP